MRDSLSREEIQYNSLVGGFWPCTRQAFDQDAFNEANDHEDDGAEDQDFFIGQRYLCPERAFRISRDCRQGYFVLVKPVEGSQEPVWMGLAESDPNLDVGTENFKHILLRWYMPAQRRGFNAGSYEGWDTNPRMKWEADVTTYEEAEWVKTEAVITAWKPRSSNVACVSIPSSRILKALSALSA